MRRHILGTLALLSLVVALLLTIWPQPDYEVYHAGACRLGLFLTALWLGLSADHRPARFGSSAPSRCSCFS